MDDLPLIAQGCSLRLRGVCSDRGEGCLVTVLVRRTMKKKGFDMAARPDISQTNERAKKNNKETREPEARSETRPDEGARGGDVRGPVT